MLIPASSTENLLEMHILEFDPDLLDQRLWGWDPIVPVLMCSPRDSDAAKRLRTTSLKEYSLVF